MAFDEAVIGSNAGSVADSFTVANSEAAIPEGATLRIGAYGAGYDAAAGVVTGVSDNVNGDWTELHNSGDQEQDGTHHYSLAAYHFIGSAAVGEGDLEITITQTPGQADTAAIADYLSGGETSGDVIDVSAYDDTNNSATDDSVTQEITAAQAGDSAWFIGSSYATGGSISANEGTDLVDSIGGSGGPPVGWMAIGTDLTSAGDNTYGVDLAGSASFMASYAAAYLPGGSGTTTDFDAEVDATSDVTAGFKATADAGAGVDATSDVTAGFEAKAASSPVVEATSDVTAGFSSTVKMGLSVEARSGATVKITGGGTSSAANPPAVGRGPVRRLGVGPS